MNLITEFKARGMLAQTTNETEIDRLLQSQRVTFYIGFDPTADSLHIGHYMQMKVIAHMQRAGHMPIVIFGGGTAMIGDPTGKTDMRRMMTVETINHNIACFKQQMSKYIDISEGKVLFINNADWLLGLNYVEFLRDIGVHFSVNRMLTFECYKSRLEKGLSFLEFNYMLLQSYDFYRLFKDHECIMQLGGDDQWSNMLGGVELVRRKESKEVYGMTFSLLENSDGKKMGKTEKGAVWLDAEKMTPYDFFQYWRNTADADVIKMLYFLTFLPVEEIKQYESHEGSQLNKVKEILAFEITKIIHGEEEAAKALEAARALFSSAISNENMPTTTLTADDFTDGKITVIDMLVKSKLAPSKGEARRLIAQGGVLVNDDKVTTADAALELAAFESEVIVKKGKKSFQKFVAE